MRTSAIINPSFPGSAEGRETRAPKGHSLGLIYPKRTEIANVRLRFRHAIGRGRNLSDQLERIGKELRPAEITGFQRQQHFAAVVAFRGTDRAQHRNAGGNLCTHEKAGNPQAIHHRAGGLASRDHQPAHARQHQSFGDVGHRLLNRVACGIAAVARLQGRHQVRRRTGGDQDRPFLEPLSRPAQRAPGFVLARDDLLGIEVQHRHVRIPRLRSAVASPANNCRQDRPPARRPARP